MTNLPTGTATFLFTDIEGSTPLWERDPEGMREALALHNAVLADAIAAHDGHWFKTVGDAFQAAFADPAQAVLAALAGQRGLAQAEWGHTGPLLVRMGIHTGPAIAEETDYVATHTLNRVARIMSAAHGGQIILSQEVLDELAHRMPEEITLRDMGKHRMKGLTHLEHLYQVVAPDLPAEYPRLSTLDISPNNLPLQLTSFIGREKELREVMELLSTCRLVTLTGPGGCGKTRLSLEAAERVQDTHPHGVWLVELAPLADPALIPQTLAAVLGLREEGDRPNLTVLTDFLRTRTLFLVLDNCEHLIEACARLADGLLKACPKIHILASSRETLGISGEAAYRVPSLGVPDPHQRLPVDQLLQYASVKLFVERARTVLPGFSVTGDNAPAVVQVCHRLDGIPLAIELAAARAKMLTVEQIATRLDDRFRLLTGGSRTALPRQQTLRALVDWSFSLLSEQECVLFRRLSVFAGGWTLDAAEAVCTDESRRVKDENHPSAVILHPSDVLDLLSQLASKSLVMVEREQGKDARYRLLETIRQYARDKLLESSEVSAVRDRHLHYFLEVAEKAEPQLRGAGLVQWMRRLNQDLDNLRAAMEWAREDRESAAQLGLRLSSSLWWFAFIGNTRNEGTVWLKEFLDRYPENNPIRLLAWARYLFVFRSSAHFGDQLEEALSQTVQLLQAAEKLGDPSLEALAHYIVYWIRYNMEEPSLKALQRAQDLFSHSNDIWWLGRILMHRGELAQLSGDMALGLAFYEQALEANRKCGDERGIALGLSELAEYQIYAAELQAAEKLARESLEIHLRVGSTGVSYWAYFVLSDALLLQGKYKPALGVLTEYSDLADRIGLLLSGSECLLRIGDLLLCQGEFSKALDHFNQIMPASHRKPDLYELARKHLCLAMTYTHLGRLAEAEQSLESARSYCVQAGFLLLTLKLAEAETLFYLASGNVQNAHKPVQDLITSCQHNRNFAVMTVALEFLAWAFYMAHRLAESVRLFAATSAFRAQKEMPMLNKDKLLYEPVIASLQAQLGGAVFNEAWAEGRAIGMEQAITYALEE